VTLIQMTADIRKL